MSFSYGGNPSSSDHDAVRFLAGDTVDDGHRLEDEEIAWLLTEWPDVYQAAAAGADHMAATAAQWLSYSADGNQLSLSDLQAKYRQLADDLRYQGRRRFKPTPYVGGIDLGDHQANGQDASVNPLNFGIGMHDDLDEGSPYGGSNQKDLLGGPWT